LVFGVGGATVLVVVVVVVVLVVVLVVVVDEPTDVVVVVDDAGEVVVVVVPLATQVVGSAGAPSSKSRQPSRSRSMPIRVPEPERTAADGSAHPRPAGRTQEVVLVGQGLRFLVGDHQRVRLLLAIGLHQGAQHLLHDGDLGVHRHEAVERSGPVLLVRGVAIGKDREMTSGFQDGVGCQFQVNGQLGECLAIDDHVVRPSDRPGSESGASGAAEAG